MLVDLERHPIEAMVNLPQLQAPTPELLIAQAIDRLTVAIDSCRVALTDNASTSVGD